MKITSNKIPTGNNIKLVKQLLVFWQHQLLKIMIATFIARVE